MRVVSKGPRRNSKHRRKVNLGPVEARVMGVLWACPGCTVHEVKDKLPGNRAYNTVMTTMVRLFQKDLLRRRKRGHSFIYSPQLSTEDWGRLAASEFVTHFVEVPNATHDLLASSLVTALDQLDPGLLRRMKGRVPAKGTNGKAKRS